MEEQLFTLFRNTYNKEPLQVEKLPQAGSNRCYYRMQITATKSVIGVIGTSESENSSFINLTLHFTDKGLPVPHLIAFSPDYNCYLQEDLGGTALFDLMANGRATGDFDDVEREMLHATIALLPQFQYEGAKNLNFNFCYPQPAFDYKTVMWDLNYFKYCFLKSIGLEFEEVKLEADFEQLAKLLLSEPATTFMYRDFQSRNVMIHNGKPRFIDYQGGRKGPIYYDVASFIGQAKANFPPEMKEELIATYLNALRPYNTISTEDFKSRLQLFTLFRTLQVLGAYGFRGYQEHKTHFLQSMPFAIKQLKEQTITPIAPLPYLYKILGQIVALPRFAPQPQRETLVVKIYSFSYHKGIPDDESGNGGGFVFDCRALSNPGRYPQYRQSTGLDADVIQFFAQHPDIFPFIEETKSLIRRSVEIYQNRGFLHLMVSFGCTGGQHRSVFSAQQIANWLYQEMGVKVELIHRELNIKKEYPQ